MRFLILLLSIACINAFSPLHMTLPGLHSSLFAKIKNGLALKPTDFPSKYESDKFVNHGFEGECQWWDETKGSKLTGVSVNTIINPVNGFAMYTINCWMGPAYMVPHMLLSLTTDPIEFKRNGIRADYLARGPTPLGSDQTYLDLYYGKDVINWVDKAIAIPDTSFLPPLPTFSGRLLRSPVELAIGGLTDEAITEIATAHVDRWLNFIAEAKQNEARQRGAVNTRDDKQRMFAYQAELHDCAKWVGKEFGPKLGAARTGPVAEAYVGGGG